MGRKPRLFASGVIYHVYCRTARGEYVFDEPSEIERWIDTVAYVADQDRLTILAWCLLSNHYHLVLQTEEAPLCRAMARIQGRIAKGFNRRKRWTGRLWQSRYKARIVTEQIYLKHLFAYVHLNPVAAGIVTDPYEYGPSGHRALLGKENPRLIDVGAALLCFHEDPVRARNIYMSSIRSVAEARWLRSDVRDLPWWVTVDDDDQTILQHLKPDNAELFDGTPPPELGFTPSLDQIAVIAHIQLDLSPNQLRGRGRSRYESWCRCLLTAVAVGQFGHRVKDLAEYLDKSSVSVSRWLSYGGQLRSFDQEFRSRLRRITAQIRESAEPLPLID